MGSDVGHGGGNSRNAHLCKGGSSYVGHGGGNSRNAHLCKGGSSNVGHGGGNSRNAHLCKGVSSDVGHGWGQLSERPPMQGRKQRRRTRMGATLGTPTYAREEAA